jgi:LysM repeat protein
MTCPFRFFEYIAETGDTYASTAKMFSIDENSLKAFNKNTFITQGAPLKIPSYSGGCARGVFYVIKQTDTLYRISRRFGILLTVLLSANPYFNPAYFFPGQVIIIPRTNKSLVFYTLGHGERLIDILKKYNMDLSMFCALNPALDPLNLTEGQRIKVRKKIGFLYRHYIMKPGDSIISVTVRFRISVDTLLSSNGGLRPGEFLPGAVVRIPINPFGVD